VYLRCLNLILGISKVFYEDLGENRYIPSSLRIETKPHIPAAPLPDSLCIVHEVLHIWEEMHFYATNGCQLKSVP